MKKLFTLLLCGFFCMAVNAFGQKHAERLIGVWQQYQETIDDKGNKRMMHLPVWKVLQSDGQFCTFLIANASGSCLMTNKGTYEVVGEHVYNEKIEKSIVNSKLVGKTNPIHFKYEGKDRLVITYQMPGVAHAAVEIWQRVKMSLPRN